LVGGGMKIQLEEIDLLDPWPELAPRGGYRTMSVLVRLGRVPIGEVMLRPARSPAATHRRLRRRIADKLSWELMSNLTREGLAAGPAALMSIPAGAFPRRAMMFSAWEQCKQYVEQHFVLPEGLPEELAAWVRAAQDVRDQPAHDCPPVTIAVCTRDRPAELEQCIRCLRRLDYAGEFEILIVDNGSEAWVAGTRAVAEKLGVCYVRAPIAGLSRARNIALLAARHEWVAFADDDCRPDLHWLRELVRPTRSGNCRAVCGLVQPARLENSAEITFETYGGLGRGYRPKVFDIGLIRHSLTKPAPTWRIGAGANMLVHRETVLGLGGFDEDMGPGGVGGCGEDTLVFYQLLRAGHAIHYTPRAVVRHHHRSSPAALRKQIHSYAVGHAAYHWRVFAQYRDYRSLIRLMWHLPLWFAKNLRAGLRGKSRYPLSLVLTEIRGTLRGPAAYTAARARRFARSLYDYAKNGPPSIDRPQPRVIRPESGGPAPIVFNRKPKPHDPHAGNKSHRAA
jgi:glycosyltransferase involved in cell wall biosynthesis